MDKVRDNGLPWANAYDPAVPHSLNYPEVTLADLFQESVAQFGDRTALIYFGKSLTYKDLAADVGSVAQTLRQLMPNPAKLAIILPNCPQYVICFYAALMAGATVVPINPLSTESELQHIFHDSGPRVVVCLDLLAGKLEAVRDYLRANGENHIAQHVYYTSLKDFMPRPLKWLYPFKQKLPEAARRRLDGALDFACLVNEYSGPLEVPVIRQDPAVVIYTGGTTGKPKGVMLSHYALVANATQIRAWGNVRETDRQLVVLPLFHGFGMSVCMNSTIIAGGSSVLMPRFEAGEVLKNMDEYKPTLFAGVPTMYIALNTHPKITEYQLSSLRACYVGAAALPQEVKKRFESLTGARLMEGYGLTEAVTAICANPYAGENRAGSIGIPFSDVIMAIRDVETGEVELGPNKLGEIVIQSPTVMQGYYNRTQETAEALRNGWLYTGDIGYMDEAGYFYIVDRKKDMIITGGFNVYPKEVEDVLYNHPAVKEASVIGVPDPYKGERVKAYVTPQAGATLEEAEVIAYCKQYLSPYKVPRQVEVCQELPKSAIGKILKRALRDMAGQTPGGDSPNDKSTTARGDGSGSNSAPPM